MATLQGTSLVDCFYIPDFIESGSKTLFENATAPTSWTKDTTYNNAALRIVNGTIGNGGSTIFSDILTTRSVEGTVSSVQSGFSVNSVASGISIGPADVSSPMGQSATATAPHTHPYTRKNTNLRAPGPAPRIVLGTTTSGSVGQNGQHSHSFGPWPHNHTFSDVQHSHTLTESSHDHTITASTQDFNVYYRDVILATKD